jgi:RNA polymerase subunit RPABC4/transcription elongation factor Spt4
MYIKLPLAFSFEVCYTDITFKDNQMQKTIDATPRITDENRAMYIANCRICTIATNMKDCPNCLFNVGLVGKPEKSEFAKRLTSTVNWRIPYVQSPK